MATTRREDSTAPRRRPAAGRPGPSSPDPSRHDVRRHAIAGAVSSVITRGGLEAVSIRSVAAEAGVSMGGVQYYFSTKSELLRHGLADARQRIDARLRARIAENEDCDRAAVLAVLDELLGESVEVRDALRVHAAFAVTPVGTDVGSGLTNCDEMILALVTSVIAAVRPAGSVGDDGAAEVDGYGLWILARGLGFEVALRGAPIDGARRTLGRQLRLLHLLPERA